MNTELNAVRNFRADLAALKALMRWKNEDVAKWLKCDASTVSKRVFIGNGTCNIQKGRWRNAVFYKAFTYRRVLRHGR